MTRSQLTGNPRLAHLLRGTGVSPEKLFLRTREKPVERSGGPPPIRVSFVPYTLCSFARPWPTLSAVTLPAQYRPPQNFQLVPSCLCGILMLICCPPPPSELAPRRPCRLPRLRLLRLFPLRARGETASELAKSFQPTARSETGGGFLLLSPLQRRSSGSAPAIPESHLEKTRSPGHEPRKCSG